MKKPKLKDYNLTDSRIKEINQLRTKFKNWIGGKPYWLISYLLSVFWTIQIIDNETLFTPENLAISLFLMIPTASILGLVCLVLENAFYDLILPFFNSEYLNIKKYKKNLEEYENWFFRTQLNFWRSLSGSRFEVELAKLFQNNGYTARKVGGSGDKGIDLVLNESIVVQCKAYKSKVGPGAIRDLIGTMKNSGYRSGILASINGFSSGVPSYIKNNNIKLMDASHYIGLQKKIK